MLQLKFGAPGRIRTHDPLVRSQVLYPTELRAQGANSNTVKLSVSRAHPARHAVDSAAVASEPDDAGHPVTRRSRALEPWPARMVR